MSEIGVPLALGGVALLAAAGVVASRSGSAATRLSVFDGITLEVEEKLADASEGAWMSYAEMYLPNYASQAPTRAHYRTLAGHLQRIARHTAPRTQRERDEKARKERAADSLFLFADYVDSFRGGAMVHKPRLLNAGDRVRVLGTAPLEGMDTGKVYEAHLTATAGGVPTVSFRLVDSAGRATKYSTGAFPAKFIHSMLTYNEKQPGFSLLVERIAPIDLGG